MQYHALSDQRQRCISVYGILTVEEARSLAMQWLAQVTHGQAPAAAHLTRQVRALTPTESVGKTVEQDEYDELLRALVQGQERLIILQEVATERLDRTDATLRRRTQQLDRTDATHAGISATLDRLTTTLERLTEMITRHDTTLDRLGCLLDEHLPLAPNGR